MTVVERRPDYNPAPVAVEADLSRGAASLVTWALEADAAYQLAQKLVDTTFCPKQYRSKPAEAAAAMLAGAEVGLSPMASLRSFDDIQGTAAPRALTLRAIAQAHGCEFVTVSESPDKVVMKGRRRGGEWDTVTWTMERARGLGLQTKDNWRKQPQAMLVARATSELARRIAADAILGIPYSSEELDDDQPAPATKVKRATTPTPAAAEPSLADTEDPGPEPDPTPVKTVRARSRTTPAATEPTSAAAGSTEQEPPVEPDGPPASDPADRPGYITAYQLRMLHAMLGKAGLGKDRDAALAFCSKAGGRVVESSKDLTRIEASRIIDALVAQVDGVEDAELVEEDQ